MTREQISTIITWLTQHVDLDAMPYTHDQLRDCISAYGRLLEQTGHSEYGNALATVIFRKLAANLQTQPTPWVWLATELRFEAQVVAMGNRVEAATNYLRHRSSVTDQDLDIYNERIHRLSNLSTLSPPTT